VSNTISARIAVVVVKSLISWLMSASDAPGSSMLTITWTISAITERPMQTKRNFHRILGTTDVSHLGRIRCTTRITNQVHRINDASDRLMANKVAGPMSG